MDFIGLELGPGIGVTLKLAKYFSYAVRAKNPDSSSGKNKIQKILTITVDTCIQTHL
jgi:hypothetical protein